MRSRGRINDGQSAVIGRRSVNVPLIALAVSAVLLAVYAITALVIHGPVTDVTGSLNSPVSCDQAWDSAAGVSVDPASSCPNMVDVTLTINSVLSGGATALTATAQVFPSGVYGGTVVNGGWATSSMELSSDWADQDNWLIPSNSLIGGRTFTLPADATADIGAYPFDAYRAQWAGFVVDAVSADRIPVAQTAQSVPVSGYHVTIAKAALDADADQPAPHNARGRFAYIVEVTREPGVQMEVLLLAVIMLVGVASAVLITVLIAARRRPPSLAALGWLATFLFALLEVRHSFPGDPPVGIRLDAYVTIPVTVLILAMIVVNALLWLRRDDWDLANTPAVGQ